MESTQGSSSAEGFDSLPADSEAVVDYGEQVLDTTDPWRNDLIPEVKKYELPPMIEVEIRVSLPDTHSFEVREAREFLPDGYSYDDVADLIETVHRAVLNRFA